MKKYLFGIIALAGILTVSCNKVAEPEAVVREAAPGTHLVTIKASIAPGTRTSYADDKTFSWKAGDVIKVMTASEQSLQLVDFTAQSDGPETTFTGEVEDGFALYSNAFYTAKESYVAFGGEDDNNIYLNFPSFTYINGDSEKYYTVDSANPLENLPLVGFKGEDDDTYVFQTAAGAARFTFENIPEGAEYVAIEGSANYLSGMFAFDNTGVATMEKYRPGSYTYTDSEGKERTAYYSSRYVVYHFDRSADGKATIYMPLPVGEIPAGATVDFLDSGLNNVLYSRTIRSAIPIERNRVTEVAAFSAESNWESIGYGYFFDLPVFVYMSAEDASDDVLYSMPAVEFFQDKSQTGVYRIANPYKPAAETREYTISEDDAKEMDDYLYITVLKDNTVIYDDFYTGYHYTASSRDGQVFAACPGNWGDDNSYNFVAKYQADGTPQEIFLSSLYLYAYGNGYYYWNWPESWHYMWTSILFPGAEEQIDLSFSVSLEGVASNTPAQPTGNVELTLGQNTDIAGVDLVIARNLDEAKEMIAAGKAVRATEGGTVVVNFPADAPSGSYFAYGQIVPGEGYTENCAVFGWSEDEFDYFRADEDRELEIEDIAGKYTASNYYCLNSTGWTANPVTLTLAIEESDDPLSGDIMFTDICPEIATALAARGTVQASPVYAYFDTATGVVTIPAGQTAYTVTAGRMTTAYTVSDFYGKNASLYLREPGVLFNKTNIAFYSGETRSAWTNTETLFNRSSASSAPARSFGSQAQRFIPVAAPTASMPMYLRQSDVEIPFVGTPSKVRR